MSRGIDTIETVLPTGSSEATIIVSVSDALRSGQLVDADEQDVDPLAVLRDRAVRGNQAVLARRRLEDARRRCRP